MHRRRCSGSPWASVGIVGGLARRHSPAAWTPATSSGAVTGTAWALVLTTLACGARPRRRPPRAPQRRRGDRRCSSGPSPSSRSSRAWSPPRSPGCCPSPQPTASSAPAPRRHARDARRRPVQPGQRGGHRSAGRGRRGVGTALLHPPGLVMDRFAAFRHQHFRRYFAGQVISSVGTWLQALAVTWLVLDRTGRSDRLGIAVALQFLPLLLLGAPAGVLADRVDNRRLLARHLGGVGRAGAGVRGRRVGRVRRPLGDLRPHPALRSGPGRRAPGDAGAAVPTRRPRRRCRAPWPRTARSPPCRGLVGPALGGAMVAVDRRRLVLLRQRRVLRRRPRRPGRHQPRLARRPTPPGPLGPETSVRPPPTSATAPTSAARSS